MKDKVLICIITNNLEPLKKFLLDRIYQENEYLGYLIIHLDEDVINSKEAENIFYKKVCGTIIDAKKEAINFALQNNYSKTCFIPVNYIPSKNFIQNLIYVYNSFYKPGIVGILNQTKNYYSTDIINNDFESITVNQEIEKNLVEGLYIAKTAHLKEALDSINLNVEAYLDFYISRYLQIYGYINCYISGDFAVALKGNNKIVPKKTREQSDNYNQLLNKIHKLIQ